MISGTINPPQDPRHQSSQLVNSKEKHHLWILMAPYGLHIHHVALQQPQIEKLGSWRMRVKHHRTTILEMLGILFRGYYLEDHPT